MTSPRQPVARVAWRLAAASALVAALLVPASASAAAGDVTLTAEVALAGNVRPGAWSAVRVHLENDGPPLRGELRITSGESGRSSYGREVELASGARQDHVLYAQPGFFGARFVVTLSSDGQAVATQTLEVTTRDPYSPTVFLIAERPEGILADVREAAGTGAQAEPVVLPLRAQDLPPRVEAWAAIDRLVWQDVDTSLLSAEQLSSLTTWIAAGGRLVVVGGSTGTSTLGALPEEILPFVPVTTVDVSLDDLGALLGDLPDDAEPAPALAGTLSRGRPLARSGDHVVAAETSYGQGTVSVVGIDLGADWLAGTEQAAALWSRLVPGGPGGALNPLLLIDDGALVASLSNLPAVELPRLDQLFALLLGYIALIGPVNYLVLRRLDRREWAWVTMPVLVLVFAVAAYGLGAALKGTDVIVNELGIVRGAAGTDRGVANVYIGVFSPVRAVYDVRVRGDALLSNPASLQQTGNGEQPIDVLFGDPSHLRGYQLGFGTLRGFRAEAAVPTPRVETDLRLEGDRLRGRIVNRSDIALEDVAVTYGGGVQVVRSLAAGQAADVDFAATGGNAFFTPLSERIYGVRTPDGTTDARTLHTRRTAIDQLTAYGTRLMTSVSGGSPVILAWRRGGLLDVDVGTPANQVGDTLYVLPAHAAARGPVAFDHELIRHSMLAADSFEALDHGTSFSLGRGTMEVEYRAIGFEGGFTAESLVLGMTQGEPRPIGAGGQPLEPLPADEQPPQDDPLGDGPAPSDGPPDPVEPGDPRFDGMPDLQLRDHQTGLWVEFPHLSPMGTYLIPEPARYVDASGALRVRFVNREGAGNVAYFSLQLRMEGTAG
jgi:hypothetical protein